MISVSISKNLGYLGMSVSTVYGVSIARFDKHISWGSSVQQWLCENQHLADQHCSASPSLPTDYIAWQSFNQHWLHACSTLCFRNLLRCRSLLRGPQLISIFQHLSPGAHVFVTVPSSRRRADRRRVALFLSASCFWGSPTIFHPALTSGTSSSSWSGWSIAGRRVW